MLYYMTRETKGMYLHGNRKIQKELDCLYAKFSHHTLPRWEDLPEIDLYMDQVIALMRKYLSIFDTDGEKLLTPAMINNYVKMGRCRLRSKRNTQKRILHTCSLSAF